MRTADLSGLTDLQRHALKKEKDRLERYRNDEKDHRDFNSFFRPIDEERVK